MLKFTIAIYAVYAWLEALRVVNASELNFDSPYYTFQIFATIISFGLSIITLLAIAYHLFRTILRKKNIGYFMKQLVK